MFYLPDKTKDEILSVLNAVKIDKTLIVKKFPNMFFAENLLKFFINVIKECAKGFRFNETTITNIHTDVLMSTKWIRNWEHINHWKLFKYFFGENLVKFSLNAIIEPANRFGFSGTTIKKIQNNVLISK